MCSRVPKEVYSNNLHISETHIPDSRTWGEIIRSHFLDAKHYQVLSLFLEKVRWPHGFKPEHFVLAGVLKSCTVLSATSIGRALHSFTLKSGHLSCLSVAKGLLNFYAKSRAFDESNKLLFEIPQPDTVVWNIVLSGLSGSQKHDITAVRLFYTMHFHGDPKPTHVTVAIVLPVLARLGMLSEGQSLHSYMIRSGIGSGTLAGNALVSMYAKLGRACSDAHQVFLDIIDKDIVSWNAMISGFYENGMNYKAYMTFRNMLQESVDLTHATISSILPIFSTADSHHAGNIGRELHAYVQHRGELQVETSVINAFISFYLRLGKTREAEYLFRTMTHRDTISWNTMIAGCALMNDWLKAFHLFHEMVSGHEVEIDSVTLLSILPAFSSLKSSRLGKQIHSYVIQHPVLQDDVAIQNAMISFYANYGDINASYKVFLVSSQRDIISWNAMLDAFASEGYEPQLIDLLHWMLEVDNTPDSATLSVLVRFYGKLCRGIKVKEAHGYLIRAFSIHDGSEPMLVTTLLDAYGKCGNVNYAFKIFNSLSGGSIVDPKDSTKVGYKNQSSGAAACRLFENISTADLMIWNLMIHIYAENGFHNEALNMLCELQVRRMKPDSATIMSILPIFFRMSSIDLLRQCHGYVIRGCLKNVYSDAAMIDMYSKFGSISTAQKLFLSSRRNDLVVFTAMIGGCAMNGMGEEALKVYTHMLQLGLRADSVAITAVLAACSHSGLVVEGLNIFHSIKKDHLIQPTMEQYACVVDLLARGGQVRDAYDFMANMPVEPNAEIWNTLLNACRIYNEHELGKICATKLVGLNIMDVESCISVSNLYAADARWDAVVEIRELIGKTDSAKKPIGFSRVE